MRILILGGTRFLGRGLVEAALARGHDITLFNRGSKAGLYAGVEELRGDRVNDLHVLAGKTWDAAIDTSGYLPRVVRLSAEALQGQVERYVFISTLSVYASFAESRLDENAPTGCLVDETVETIDDDTYGPLKVLCEQAVEDVFPGRAFIPRPGLIVGRYDPTDRFTYWPHRVEQGGDVLAPGQPGEGIQFIDVHDLSEWIILGVERGYVGVYNATGPRQPLPMGHLLETCRQVSKSDARFVWVPEEFLLRTGVQPWSELPVWMPRSVTEMAGFFQINCEKAVADGLKYRPVADTIRDTLEWQRSRPVGEPLKAGMSREREQELLRAYQTGSGEGNV